MRIGIVLALLVLASCNTVEGIGEDISSGARSVKNSF